MTRVYPEFRHKSLAEEKEDIELPEINEVVPHKVKTEWGKLYLTAVLIFLTNFEKHTLSLADWLYMKQLDNTLTPDFFGLVLAVARTGHAILTIAFSYWRQEAKTTKNALMIGRVCDLLALVLYCTVEMFGFSWRKWVLMVVYFLVYAMGLGSIISLRTNLIDCSAPEDRSSAFALRTIANVSSMLLAPILQIGFAGMTYPGVALGHENIRLHIFSGPLIVTLITNSLAMVILLFIYKEPAILDPKNQLVRTEPVSTSPTSAAVDACIRPVQSHSMLSRLWGFVRRPNFSWTLVLLIWGLKGIFYASNASVLVTHAAWCQIGFGWTAEDTVTVLTNAKIGLGVVSVLLTIFFFKMGHRIGDNLILLLCASVGLGHYLITFPTPFLAPNETPQFNETTRGGCNSTEYSWCGAAVGNEQVWVISSVTQLMIVIQIGLVCSDAIYSTLLDKIDQSMMQGFMIVFTDGIQMFGAMYSASMFTAWGLEPLWILNIIIGITAVLVSIFYYKPFGYIPS